MSVRYRNLCGACFVLAAMAAHGAAQTPSCSGERPPDRLWSLTLDAAGWSETPLHQVAVTGTGRIVAFGHGERIGDDGKPARWRMFAAIAPLEGGAATVHPIVLPLARGMEPRDSSEIVAAAALPDGDVLAAIAVNVDSGRNSIRRLMRIAPDGTIRARHDSTTEASSYGRIRLTADGIDRVAILGSSSLPPFVDGIFESYDFSLRRVAAYDHPPNATIFQFARGPGGAYTLHGDWGGQIAQAPEGAGAGRFRVRLSATGRPGRTQRIGGTLSTNRMSGLVFDHRDGTTLLVASDLVWIARDGSIARRHPVPRWAPDDDSFAPEPRLDEPGCALLFESSAQGRLMRIGRDGAPLWRTTLRAGGAGEVSDVVPVAGGFVAVGRDETKAGASPRGWIARFAYR